ncbi:MAG: amidohydrolase family protein [Desulfobulbaceae bacterium]|nr:amidohydrolase family protein [Desulfobulbaceae bacterium]
MGETRFVVAGAFIDGNGTTARKNVFLAIKDGIITAIGPTTELSVDQQSIDDFSHCTILPALVDCSVSLLQSPSVDGNVRLSAREAGRAGKAALLERHIQDYLAHGVQGVANNDAIAPLLGYLPNDLLARHLITIRSSVHPSRNWHAHAAGDSVSGDFLKVSYSASIEGDMPSSPTPTQEELCQLLQRRGGRRTVVVANGQQQVAEAIKAGCDAIEQGYGMGEANLREMAEREMLWIPTVLRAKNGLDGASAGGDLCCCRFSMRYVAPGKAIPGAEAFWQKTLDHQLEQLRLAKKIGLTTAVGSGAGSVGILHGESIAEEMKLFIKAGFSQEEAIRSASANGAIFFSMDNLGVLAVGKRATFLITRGTVQQLPRKLSFLEGIYVDGVPSSTYQKVHGKSLR